jgi:hypothetical protein
MTFLHFQDSYGTTAHVSESHILHLGRTGSKILMLTDEEFYEVTPTLK